MSLPSSTSKRALITGATSGIGRATAELFARNGIEVGVLAEIPELVEETVASIRAGNGKAFPVHANLSKPEQVTGLIDQLEGEYGPIRILVNNAGIGHQGDVIETRDSDVRLLFEVNFFAMVTLSREAFKRMSERRSGHIINVSSASARRALPGLGVYAATKAAMHSYSQTLRIEGKSAGIHVTEILPMSVQTPFFERATNRSKRPYQVGSWSTTPDRLATLILRAVDHPKPEVYTSAIARFVLGIDAMVPGGLDAMLTILRRVSRT